MNVLCFLWLSTKQRNAIIFFFHASFTSYRNNLFLNAIDSIIFKTDNEVVEKNNHGTPKGGETPSPSPSELKCLSVKS